MSSSTPGPPDGHPASEPAGTPQVEYLGGPQQAPSRKSRRTGLVVAGTVAAVAAAGAGAWAVTQFMSGGPAPATAVPSDAFGYVAIDLDPDGGQKIEAIRTLRKFPAIQDELDLDTGDDLRRVIYDAITVDDPCPDIDYADDIEPWLGSKVAFAAVPGDDEPVPFAVVQVKDEKLAGDAIDKIADCSGEDAPGTAFVGDFMVVAESADLADGIASDAEEGSLDGDEEFGRWIDEAGGSGIVEAYLSADAPKYFVEEADATMTGGLDEMTGSGATSLAGTSESPSAPSETDVEEAFKDFEGAAMVVRFDDEALEMEAAGGGLPADFEIDGESGLSDLPSTTALAMGIGVSDTAVQDLIDSFTESAGLSEDEVDEMLAEAEAQTGLELPEDVQALLGDGFSLAVDSSVDMDSMINSSEPPEDLPAGVRIVGDPDEITPVLDKLREAVGPMGDELVVEEGDGVVAIGIDDDYVALLAEDGSLGDEDRFQSAMEDADTDTGGVYVDFDAGDWLTELAATDPDERIEENVDPLDSLGISGSIEDDSMHWLVRLTTD